MKTSWLSVTMAMAASALIGWPLANIFGHVVAAALAVPLGFMLGSKQNEKKWGTQFDHLFAPAADLLANAGARGLVLGCAFAAALSYFWPIMVAAPLGVAGAFLECCRIINGRDD